MGEKNDQILFLGKYDDNLRVLEENVINCLKKEKTKIKVGKYPDVKSYSTDYKCNIWVIIGDVKPTLLLKNLISQANIIFFVFDISNLETFDFLNEGWGPIIEKVDKNEGQKRFLIGLGSQIESSELDDRKGKEKLKYDEYYYNNNCQEIFDYLEKYKKSNLHSNDVDGKPVKTEDEVNNQNKINNDNDNDDDKIKEEEENDENSLNDDISKFKEEEDEDYTKQEFIKEITDTKSVKFKLYEKNQKFIAVISKSPEAKEDVFIPTFVNFNSKQYEVIKIGDHAFKKAKIDSLSFANDSAVKSIGELAFAKSTITSFSIPKSLTRIGDSWCQGADKLNEIVVEKGNRYFKNRNNFLIFEKDSKSEILFAPRDYKGDFKIPKETTAIGNSAFSKIQGLLSLESESPKFEMADSISFFRCKNLKTVRFVNGESLTLGSCCFANATNLLSVDISSKLVHIQKYCFSNCKSLASITLSNVDKVFLEKQVFKECKSLENFIVNKASEIKIGEKCFDQASRLKSIGLIADTISLSSTFLSNCESLSFINIQCKNGDISILSNTFESCRLKNVTIFSSKLKLSPYCFRNSEFLESVEIQSEYIEIGVDCFRNCPSLAFITLQSGKDVLMAPTNFEGCNSLKFLALKSSSNLVLANKFMSGAPNLEKVSLSGKFVSICDSCFKDCKSLNEFEIADSGSIQIGKDQFINCPKIEKISISLTFDFGHGIEKKVEFGNCCFSSAFNLKEFVLTGGDVKISNDCFKSCTRLSELVVEKASSITIDKNQFSNCKSLKEVKLGSYSNIVLNEECFSGCSNLINIDFGASSKINVGEKCFFESSIKEAHFEGETITINNNCFQKCKSMTKFTISSAREVEIKPNAFEGCENLKNVTIDSSFSLKIQENCFNGDKNLQLLGLTGSKIVIGKKSFYNCSSIPYLQILDSDNFTIEDNAFEGCANLQSVVITAKTEFQANIECFSSATKLNRVQITSKKVIISRDCFSKCTSLVSFLVSGSEDTTLSSQAFDGCSSLEVVDVTGSNKLIVNNFCFIKAKKLNAVIFRGENIFIGSNCFKKCTSLKSIDAPNAKNIRHYNTLKLPINCPNSAKIDVISNESDQNNDTCNIF